MPKGFIKLHRCIIDSDIYQMPPLYLRVFERLLLEANHKDKNIPYRDPATKATSTTKLIKRGEGLCSLRLIAEWVSWYERGQLKTPNTKTIKQILDWLVSQKMIYIYGESNRKETHYKVLNYEVYQAKESDESNSLETVQKRSTDTNKNDKNDKNEKNDIYPDSHDGKTPYQKIVNLYQELCPSFPKIITMSESRKTHIKARYTQYKCNIDIFIILFNKAEASDFLKGNNDRHWKANFDWLINETNMAKVLEGRYDNSGMSMKKETKEEAVDRIFEEMEVHDDE